MYLPVNTKYQDTQLSQVLISSTDPPVVGQVARITNGFIDTIIISTEIFLFSPKVKKEIRNKIELLH